jgi:small subunit ribosomal protein S17
MSLIFKKPKKECSDRNCPFHGRLSMRGRVSEGTVISSKMDKTVIVKRDYLHYIRKYLRYERKKSQIPCHNPPCINATEGDRVKIIECRPISKTVSFVVVEKMETR